MGQWAVSVLGLEPLHLEAALTSPARWQQGYLTPTPGEGPGLRVNRRPAAGPRKVHPQPERCRVLLLAADAALPGTGRGERVSRGIPERSPTWHTRFLRARGVAGSAPSSMPCLKHAHDPTVGRCRDLPLGVRVSCRLCRRVWASCAVAGSGSGGRAGRGWRHGALCQCGVQLRGQ
jgi:hypothetical protein